MNHVEFREALSTLGISISGAGRLFGTHPRTAHRWAAGTQDVPRAVEIALGLMIKHRVRPDQLPGATPKSYTGVSVPAWDLRGAEDQT